MVTEMVAGGCRSLKHHQHHLGSKWHDLSTKLASADAESLAQVNAPDVFVLDNILC
jgi:hypothetical protein